MATDETAEHTETIEQPNSVKIAISQKGAWSGEVKSYAKTIDEAFKLAVAKAVELEQIIRSKNV